MRFANYVGESVSPVVTAVRNAPDQNGSEQNQAEITAKTHDSTYTETSASENA